jgi:membrane associated rhomboid family serine protease
MVAAAVGYQCRTCVNEGLASVRRVKSTDATFTRIIIGICIGVFGYETLLGQSFSQQYGLAGVAVFEWGEYYRFFTAMFLHAGIIHIMFNMLVLWQLGNIIEPRIGTPRFAVLYLVSGFGAGIASVLLNDAYTVSVGASGAIFGLMGAFWVFTRRWHVNSSQVTSLIAINLILGFVLPGVDWHAHVGGLIAGAALATLIPRR